MTAGEWRSRRKIPSTGECSRKWPKRGKRSRPSASIFWNATAQSTSALLVRLRLVSDELVFEGHALVAVGERADAVLARAMLGRHDAHDLEEAERLQMLLVAQQLDRLPDLEFMHSDHGIGSFRRAMEPRGLSSPRAPCASAASCGSAAPLRISRAPAAPTASRRNGAASSRETLLRAGASS